MEEIEIKKNSWHFKLLAWARGTRSMLPRSQCSYTWVVITSMMFSPVILIGKVAGNFIEFQDKTGLPNTILNGLVSIMTAVMVLIAFVALPVAAILDPDTPLWLGFFFYLFVLLIILILVIVWAVIEYIDCLEEPPLETPQYKLIDSLKDLWKKVCKPVTYK